MRYFENFHEMYDVLRKKIVARKLPEKKTEVEVSEDMTKAELQEIAKKKGIEVKAKATKADILKAIKETQMATATLNKAISVPVDLKLWTKPDGERAHQVWWRFLPGEEYELPEGDDLFLQDLAKQKTKKRYDPALEMKLKEMGVAAEVELCKVCGGKKKFLTYPTVEINYD